MASVPRLPNAGAAARYDPAVCSLTAEAGPLSREQRRLYERDGYVLCKGVFQPGELAHIHQHYLEVCREPERYVGSRVVSLTRDVNVVKGIEPRDHLPREFSTIKLNGFAGSDGPDEVFCSYMRHPSLLPFVQQFVQSDEVTTASHMYVCKPPGLSETTRHPMHQDLLYFPQGERDPDGVMTSRSKGSIVCAWTALGPCTRENGALTLLPGSHWRGLRAHGYPDWEGEKNIAYFGIRDLDGAEIEARQHIEMDAGDCCFFHPEAIHGSGRNAFPIDSTDPRAFRKAISVHFFRTGLELCDWRSLPPGKSGATASSFGAPTPVAKGRKKPEESGGAARDEKRAAKKRSFHAEMQNMELSIPQELQLARARASRL